MAELLTSDAQLQAMGVNPNSLSAGDVDTPEPRPYIVLQWGETIPGVDVSRRRTLTVWVHDKPNDYTVIDQIIKRIRQIYEGLAGYKTTTGWITSVDWVTDSDDLTDDGPHTICRTTAYTVIGSGL
jgi:hypothetical protein